ncbi:Highly reducing polyketide synthase ACRTS2 [Metarhizium brunneum]|uniref:Highly reducing polyketide synthase ACRTS2 n=1 Tax=Metarhizium brunneum TaxID=500148 RepID=A0A7D5V4H7_9HYPO|nr:Highly reducing polyketide synthase ACRTS2 [Metarhizium brunneum]
MKTAVPLVHSHDMKESSLFDEIYASGAREGTIYGPAFKSTIRYWEAPSWTVMESKLRELDTARSFPPSGSLFSADPPTLDGFLQGFLPLQYAGRKWCALMSTYVGKLRVSNHIPLDHDKLLPIAEWESVTFRSISSAHASDALSRLPASFYHDLLSALDFASHADWPKFITAAPADGDGLRKRVQHERVALEYMKRAVDRSSNLDYSDLPEHLSKFMSWGKRCVAREEHRLMKEPLPDLSRIAKADAGGESLYFRWTDALVRPLGDGEAPPGLEGVGVVSKVGSGVGSLGPGDRVYYGLHGGCLATHVRIPAWQANKVPDGWSNADAASISIAYQVAYLALCHHARPPSHLDCLARRPGRGLRGGPQPNRGVEGESGVLPPAAAS